MLRIFRTHFQRVVLVNTYIYIYFKWQLWTFLNIASSRISSMIFPSTGAVSRWSEVYGEDIIRCEIGFIRTWAYHPFAQGQYSCSDNKGCNAKTIDDLISVWKGAKLFLNLRLHFSELYIWMSFEKQIYISGPWQMRSQPKDCNTHSI